MHVNSLTDIGLVRKFNEDNYLVDKGRSLFVVADGMGGHEGGGIASDIAIKTLDELIVKNPEQKGNILHYSLQEANEKIYQEAKIRDCSGMGTTVTAALFFEDKLYIGHIGDSRAYLIRDNQIKVLTQDHSLVEELIRQGELTEEEAIRHPHRNVLTRALGTESEVKIDLVETEVAYGDLLLLCTDGLHSFVSDEEILDLIIKNNSNLKKAVECLVEKALNRGGLDNITVVLVSNND